MTSIHTVKYLLSPRLANVAWRKAITVITQPHNAHRACASAQRSSRSLALSKVVAWVWHLPLPRPAVAIQCTTTHKTAANTTSCSYLHPWSSFVLPHTGLLRSVSIIIISWCFILLKYLDGELCSFVGIRSARGRENVNKSYLFACYTRGVSLCLSSPRVDWIYLWIFLDIHETTWELVTFDN